MSHHLAFLQNFSFSEIAIVGIFIVLLFGAKRLPELFGSIGKSIKEFKRGMHEAVADTEAELKQQSETEVYSERSKSA